MGRYTTVQAYADNNANMRSVPYDQAAGAGAASGSGSGAEAKKGVVRPEKVDNPYGSTAGAGSGEFHVYRHARSREMARLKSLDEAEAEEKADAEFQAKKEAWREEEERRLEKRRKKRRRGKEARERKKNLKLGGVGGAAEEEAAGAASRSGGAADDDEEFVYVPIHQPAGQEDVVGDDGDERMASKPPAIGDANAGESSASAQVGEASASVPFANDGSFLEMTKRKLAEEEAAAAAVSTGQDVPTTSNGGATNSATGCGAEGPENGD